MESRILAVNEYGGHPTALQYALYSENDGSLACFSQTKKSRAFVVFMPVDQRVDQFVSTEEIELFFEWRLKIEQIPIVEKLPANRPVILIESMDSFNSS